MAKALVVGGNGFLGSYLVDELVSRGHEVTVFDRFTEAGTTYESADVHRVVGDFLDSDALEGALKGQEFLFHFLSTSTPASAENDPFLDVRTNVVQSIAMLNFAVAAGVSRVHFASTGGAMYGDTVADSFSEEALPAPMSPYAIGKLAIEGYLRYFQRKHGLESVSYRISNPYGPRQRPRKKQGVIPIFLQCIAEGEPVSVFGDGSTVRDFIFAEDAARMIARTVGIPARYDVYNIGSGTGTSLREVVELARDITGQEVVTREWPQPATFVDRVVLDVSRYSDEFGDIPLMNLRDGMHRTWLSTLEQMS